MAPQWLLWRTRANPIPCCPAASTAVSIPAWAASGPTPLCPSTVRTAPSPVTDGTAPGSTSPAVMRWT
jgi:hypothetical protein